MTTTKYHACNLCEAICGLKFTMDGNEITSVKGNPEDVFSKGHICPKAIALKDVYLDPDRLKSPVKKTSTGWEKISWKQAFDEIYENISKIQQQSGHDAVGIYQGNPTVHNLEAMLFGPQFFKSLKTRNFFSATSVDQLPEQLVSLKLFGHSLLVPVPDVDHTDFMMILGANPVVSNGSLMTAPGIKKRLKAMQQRNGKLVVVDPRKSETAQMADQHLFIKPGQDPYLLLAILNQLFTNDLVNLKQSSAYCDNLDKIESMVVPYTPSYVESITGIPAVVIETLTKDFCAAEKACCYGRIGVSTHPFGTFTQWLIILINILTGNLDSEGGVMFSLPAFDFINRNKNRKNSRNKSKTGFADAYSRVRGLPNFNGEFPVATLAEEILEPGEGQIRAMFTHCGNPLLSTPNAKQLEQAFKQLDYYVAIDFYINETTRHADIILPPPSALERPHYDIIFHTLAIRNTSRYSEPLFKPAKGTLSDTEIFLELSRRFKNKKGLKSLKTRLQNYMLKKYGIEKALDHQFRSGPYAGNTNLNVKTLKKSQNGIDLGSLTSVLPKRLMTANNRVDLAPEMFLADLKRLENSPVPSSTYPMLLIGRRDPRTNNSWLHNSRPMVKGKNRCVALISEKDACDFQIQDGDLIEVKSRVGSIRIEASPSAEMMPGVISIPHGWGHDGEDLQLQIASSHPGVNTNILTDDQFLDEISGNTALNGVAVAIKKLAGNLSA